MSVSKEPLMDENGLILPKKISNPCLESLTVKNLHREIRWNAKTGTNVLNNKSELERALDKHRKLKNEKEKLIEQDEQKNPFQKMLEERAKRLQTLEKQDENNEIDQPLGESRLPTLDTHIVIKNNDSIRRSSENINHLRRPTENVNTVRKCSENVTSMRKPSENVNNMMKHKESKVGDNIWIGRSNSLMQAKTPENSNNSRGSSNSSSPEEESEFLKVFAQLRGGTTVAD